MINDNGWLFAVVIDSLVTRLLVIVRKVKVFEHDELPDLTSEIWP